MRASDPDLLRRLRQIRYRDPRFEAEYGYFPMRPLAERVGVDRRVIYRACASGKFGRKPKQLIAALKPTVDAIFDRKLISVQKGQWPQLFDSNLAHMRLYK